MEARIICSYRFTASLSGWIVIRGSSLEFMYLYIPYKCKVVQPDALKQILKRKCACGSKVFFKSIYLEAAFLEDEKHTT